LMPDYRERSLEIFAASITEAVFSVKAPIWCKRLSAPRVYIKDNTYLKV
jgi:hypothetical protein